MIRVEFDPDFFRFGGKISVSDETCGSNPSLPVWCSGIPEGGGEVRGEIAQMVEINAVLDERTLQST